MVERKLTDVIETAIERDIREDRQRRHEIELTEKDGEFKVRVAAHERAIARTRAWQISVASIAAAGAVAAIAFFIYAGVTKSNQQENERYNACVSAGGTWIPDAKTDPICVGNGGKVTTR